MLTFTSACKYSNKFFYVAIQIIGNYLLFINYSVSIT